MRTSPSLGQLATILLSLSPLASAWPDWLPHVDVDALVVRQDSGNNKPTPTPTQRNSAPNTFNLNTGGITSDKPKATGGVTWPGDADATGTNTGGGSGGNGTKTDGGKGHPTEFDPRDPPGGVVMVTPAPTDPTTLYKIGDTATWGWNYTNLQATPTAIDVLLSCSAATRTYTLTQNMTFATPGSYTWDTGDFQNKNKATPLLTNEYTLIIYDAESGMTATPEAGYLGTFQGFRFGVYEKQAYTPLADGWSCASCSAAVSDVDRRALGFALTMCVVTVLSFTWFVTGFAAMI